MSDLKTRLAILQAAIERVQKIAANPDWSAAWWTALEIGLADVELAIFALRREDTPS